MTANQLNLVQIYGRALALLRPEKFLAILLATLGVLIAAVQLAEPILFGRVVDALSKRQSAHSLILLWAALGIFSIIAGVIVATYADRLAHRQKMAHMAAAFERAVALPHHYHAERGSGAVIRTILSGTSALFWLWLGAMRTQLTALFGILLMIPTAIGIDVRMAAILAAAAVAYTVMNIFVIRKTSAGQAAVESFQTGLSSRVVDVVSNVTVVQSYARIEAEVAELKRMMQQLLNAQYPVLTWWGILSVLQRSAATLTMVSVFVLGAMLTQRGELSVGEIVSFVAFASLLITKLDQLSGFAVRMHQQAPTLRLYFGLMDEKVATPDKPGAKALSDVRGDVRFDHVTFKYGDGPQGVFDLDFDVQAGDTVALVGPTGAGKSTAIALLQRFRAPGNGRITVDGSDIADVTVTSLRQSIAVVFQDAGLFNRSIAENIRMGKPNASDGDIARAARLAEAHDFIVKKPGGYDFQIGERGAALSGGERQRIAIARAILKDAPILILDEATSALDAETEAKIKRALDAVRKGRTTFVIAHRLSTVANARQILVIDQGRIVERGTFETLAVGDGLFARLVAEGGFTVPKTTGDADLPAEPMTAPAPQGAVYD